MWGFLTNSANSSAIQAIGSLVQAVAALISLFVIIGLTGKTNKISEENNKLADKNNALIELQMTQTNDRERKLEKKVSGILVLKLEKLAQILEKTAKENTVEFGYYDLDIGLSNELMVEALDIELVVTIFDIWTTLEIFKELIRSSLSLSLGDRQRKAAELVSEVLTLKQTLIELSKRSN